MSSCSVSPTRPPPDRLASALSQLGRLIKTIHILRYIHEEPLRQAIQLQLNRGEFRHILARWIFFANQGDFRTGDYEEIMNKASCLSLLSNAVLIWNTVHMTRIAEQLRAAGHLVTRRGLRPRLAAGPRPHHPERQPTSSHPGAVPTSRLNPSWPDQRRSQYVLVRTRELAADQPNAAHRQHDRRRH